MTQLRFLVWLAAVVALTLPVKAHQLDEYLQATRIDLSSNRVDLEIYLTPGVEVASVVLPLMDANHDDFISTEEGDAYAKSFLKTVILTVDKQGHELKLDSVQYLAVREMKSGTGIIQLKASVEFTPLIPSSHQLYFQNQHQTNISAYLINAYVPKSPTIRITRQKRDVRQTEIWVDYIFANGFPAPPRTNAGSSDIARPDRKE